MATTQCSDLAASLVDYAANALPAAERARVADHLAGCRQCAAAVDALTALPPLLRGGSAEPDEAFWAAQRSRIMQRIEQPARAPASGFDWRLLLPIAAAMVIAFAGYLSLRPPAAPATAVLDTLAADDLEALIEVAGDIVPSDALLPDVEADRGEAVEGAIDVHWIRVDELPAWGELDEEDLEELHEIVG